LLVDERSALLDEHPEWFSPESGTANRSSSTIFFPASVSRAGRTEAGPPRICAR
jgi:hypothetical protein